MRCCEGERAPLAGLGPASGALGTVLLYFGTFGFEPLHGFFVRSEDNRRADARNKRRRRLQRFGLAFLLISFVFAGLKEFLASP